MKRSSMFFSMLLILMSITGLFAARDDLVTGNDLDSPPFWADVLYFRAGNGEKTLTEIFVEVPYSSLTFVRTDAGYEASVELAAIYDDASGFQIDGNSISTKIRADNFNATLSSGETHLFYFTFLREPGSYTLRILVDDEYANNHLSSGCKINVPSFRQSQLQISTLQLARCIELSGQASPLKKNGRIVMPNVQHNINTEAPLGFLYFEAYNLQPVFSPADSFQVHCRISHFGKEIESASWSGAKPDTSVTISLPLNLRALDPGEYVATVTVIDQQGKRTASASTVFYMTRSSPAMTSRPSPSLSTSAMGTAVSSPQFLTPIPR
ncbi:hypothetical protein L0337_39715 [candidate division KSB1 bacterium]|nr:hypothetical protein [candidate division KSB1 bacterium]